MGEQIVTTHSPQQTEALGETLARGLQASAVVALFGGMGMGKTAFVRGMARGIGYEGDVASPTFAIVHEYNGGRLPLYHFDMYRVEDWDGLYSSGFFDYLGAGGIIVVEWSENIENALPQDCICVRFARGSQDTERRITVEGSECLCGF